MSGVVLFDKGRACLYLRDVKRHEDGSIKQAWVVNGLWTFKRRDGVCEAYDYWHPNTPVNSWPDPGFEERPAPSGNDYQDVMNKAQEDYDRTR
ncbi:hypothetical protein [Achromobacter sp. NFACC18-2]|uniref:hypothetical protein n=1 Tax=Achromobacter sp. NFACC18-2 TaxID=1564112 RepID=UPI0008C49D5F|nr:hypothetical protein [Achromobacter sp. NFACC18-2]SEJ84910.1 hypothetical protein SAMN03159494_03564 [Achromobacter sp. NFACC18-2]